MSLDLEVKRGEEVLVDMNWLRNPYGLCSWVMGNCLEVRRGDFNLYFACNRWAYGDGPKVCREWFFEVVEAYRQALDRLTEGFWFMSADSAYRELLEHGVLPEAHIGPFLRTCKSQPCQWTRQGQVVNDQVLWVPTQPGIFQERFTGELCTVEAYRTWYAELHRAAVLLVSDPTTTLYVSN